LSPSVTSNSPTAAAAAQLWLLDGNLIDTAKLVALTAELGPSERKRYDSFVRAQRAREFVLGRALLRHAVRQLFDIENASIQITERQANAPLLALTPPYLAAAFHFSLSHSHGWIACVTSITCRVAVDIEERNHPRDIDAIGAASLDEQTLKWLSQLPQPQRLAAFYRVWGCQEALYKLAHNREPGDLGDDACNCRIIEHERLAICLCSTAELETLEVIKLANI